MKRLQRLFHRRRDGTTLVEMIVTMLIFGIMMVMITGILSPAAKIFVRMQKLQFARLILDNTVQELQGLTKDAAVYVKIYDTCGTGTDLDGKIGTSSGKALEFMNTEGYVVLLSTEGCPDTKLLLGTEEIGQVNAAEAPPGRLLERYFALDEDEKYHYKDKNGANIARAFNRAFADRYYMGNDLEITFSYQPGGGGGTADDPVQYLKAEIRLQNESGETIAQDSTILDFRYQVKRKDEATAKAQTE